MCAGPAAGALSPSPNATDGASRTTRREAGAHWVLTAGPVSVASRPSPADGGARANQPAAATTYRMDKPGVRAYGVPHHGFSLSDCLDEGRSFGRSQAAVSYSGPVLSRADRFGWRGRHGHQRIRGQFTELDANRATAGRADRGQ